MIHIFPTLIAFMVLYAPIHSASQQPTITQTQANTSAAPPQKSDKSDIQALTDRAARLQKSVDSWNTAYIIALCFAGLVGLVTILCQWKTIAVSKDLVSVQSQLDSVKDRQAARELAGVQGEAAKANENAGKANERAEKAESHLAEANARASEADARAKEAESQVANARVEVAQASAKAEEFRLDIARANQSAKQAEARAAEANRIAEGERLARVRIEERMADRALTPEQRSRLTIELAKLPKFPISFESGEGEPLRYARQIISVFTGWQIDSDSLGITFVRQGPELDARLQTYGVLGAPRILYGPTSDRPNALALAKAFIASGVQVVTVQETNVHLPGIHVYIPPRVP